MLSERDKKAQRDVTWLGLWTNVALVGAKGVVGVQSGSASLIAGAST
jgi:divalent metal cation (Fe/Co/Zn/Cd) transporter